MNIYKGYKISTTLRESCISIAFPSSDLVESHFSSVFNLLSKACNQLNTVQRADHWLSLTMLELNILKLAKDNQPQGSCWIK